MRRWSAWSVERPNHLAMARPSSWHVTCRVSAEAKRRRSNCRDTGTPGQPVAASLGQQEPLVSFSLSWAVSIFAF